MIRLDIVNCQLTIKNQKMGKQSNIKKKSSKALMQQASQIDIVVTAPDRDRKQSVASEVRFDEDVYSVPADPFAEVSSLKSLQNFYAIFTCRQQSWYLLVGYSSRIPLQAKNSTSLQNPN